MAQLRPFFQVPKTDWKFPPHTTSSPELEPIRQWLLTELFDSYNYPKTWLDSRIVFETSVEGFTGFSFLTASGLPFLIASVAKTTDVAESALREKLLSSYTAGIGISVGYDTKKVRFLRRRFDLIKCEYINNIESHNTPSSAIGLQPYLLNLDPSPTLSTRTLTPLTDRIESLFFELHSHIRDIDGLHADESLDELCKLLYAKMYDEEFSDDDSSLQFQKWLYGSADELSASIRQLYHRANEYDVRVFRLRIPGYERSRGVFNLPIRLSSPAIARIVESLQFYSLTKSQSDIKGRVFQKVLVPATRAGMGQYFTPEPIVDFMVAVANPKLSELIIDPFCGSGRFLAQCLRYVRINSNRITDKSWHEFAFGKLHGIEKSDRMVRIAMTDMRLNGDGHSNIRCTDSLLAFANYPDIQPGSFDIVLTNPPFGSVIRSDAIAQLGRFDLSKHKRSVPIEILGLERSIEFLRPGGRLGIVLPESILANQRTHYVRNWLEQKIKLRGIISLPIQTFSPFGANVKTSIVFARKWEIGESRDKNYPVFLGRVDSVGYDASGRKTGNSELRAIETEFKKFLKIEGW